MTPKPPVPAPTSKGSLSKWLTGHKWEAGLGGVGVALTLYLALKSRSSSSGSSGTSSSTGASQALPVSYYPPASGGSSFDASQFASVLAGLSSELGAAGQKGTFTPPSGESQVGGGYAAPNASTPVTSASGTEFLQVPVGAASSGVQYFYQPEPGVFSPINPAGSQGLQGGSVPGGPSTPWFQSVASSA